MLSNLGNSKGGVLDAIRSAEQIDWTLGLKQAENTEFSQRSVLRSNFWSNRKATREIELKQEKIRWLYPIWKVVQFVPVVGKIVSNTLETLCDEVQAWEEAQDDRQVLFRDCAYELSIAQAEIQRILQEHPEAQTLTYEELQERSLIALKEKKLSYLVPRYWAAKNGLPESVGATLFECTDSERDYLLTRIAQKLYGFPATEQTIRLAQKIAQLPELQQQQLLDG